MAVDRKTLQKTILQLPITSYRLEKSKLGHRSVSDDPLVYFANLIKKIITNRKFQPSNRKWTKYYNFEMFITLANYLYAIGDFRNFSLVVSIIAKKNPSISIEDGTISRELLRKIRVFRVFYDIVKRNFHQGVAFIEFNISDDERFAINERLLNATGNFLIIASAIGFDDTIKSGTSINDFEFNSKIPKKSVEGGRLNNLPLFTIITAVHEKNKNLELSLESVKRQTIPNLEHLIVVDSNDAELIKYLTEYCEKDDRTKLILKAQKLGTYNSRNLALNRAEGNYFLANDSDDVLRSDALEKYLEVFENTDNVAVLASSLRITEDNQLLTPDHDGYFVRLGFPTFCFKRSIISEIGFFDTAFHSADSEFIARCRKFFPEQVVHLKEVLLLQSDGPGNLTRRVSLGHAGYMTSIERRLYRKKYREIHEELRKTNCAKSFTSISKI